MLHALFMTGVIGALLWIGIYMWCLPWCLLGDGNFWEIWELAWYVTKVFLIAYSPAIVLWNLPSGAIESRSIMGILMALSLIWGYIIPFALLEEEDKI